MTITIAINVQPLSQSSKSAAAAFHEHQSLSHNGRWDTIDDFAMRFPCSPTRWNGQMSRASITHLGKSRIWTSHVRTPVESNQ